MSRAWRNLVLGVFVLLIIAIVFIGAGAIAYGAPITAQSSSDQIAAWATRVLHAPVEPRRVVVTELPPGIDGQYDPATDVVRVTPRTARMTPVGAYARLHELLHRPDTARGCYGTEEAIVDALTQDLWPSLSVRLFGYRTWITTAYDARVRDLSYASAAVSGRPWDSRASRMVRRALWAGDCAGRGAILNNANREELHAE